MSIPSDSRVRKLLLDLVPVDGEPLSNAKLRELFDAALDVNGYKVSDAAFEKAKDALIVEGALLRGKGRGGSVRRAVASSTADSGFALQAQAVPTDALKPKPKQQNLSLAQAIAQSSTQASAGQGKGATEDSKILSYRHSDKRKNNPQVGLVNEANDPEQPKTTWRYDPHIDPVLAFDVGRAQAAKEGKGAVSLDGRLIDIASIRMAEALLKKAESIRASGGA